jgi:hypothetical protein
MNGRISKWLALSCVLSVGCGALLGEDFEGYRAKCAAGGQSACAGGSDAFAGSSGRSEAGGSSGLAGTPEFAADAGDAGSAGTMGSAGDTSSAGTTSAAGTTGTAGTTSTAGTMGSAGSTSTAGSAGAHVNPSPECQPDATIIPECTLYSSGPDYQAVVLHAARGIAMSASEAFGGGFSVFAVKRGSPTIALNYTKNVEGSQWSSWFCLDALPKPDRMAGGALLNGMAEVFATTSCGGLYRRTETANYSWLAWQSFSLPDAGTAVTDVSMSVAADGTNLVYVADGGRIFMRHRVGSDTYSPYGVWREISGASEAVLVAAGLRSDLRQQVFSIDAHGGAHTSIQTSTDLDSAFGPWSDFDSSPSIAPLVDIEVPSGGPFPLEVFAVDSNGAVWQRAQDVASSDFEAWRAWDGPAPPTPLVSLAGAALKAASGTPLHLTGLGVAGGVYTLRRTESVWGQWRQLQ